MNSTLQRKTKTENLFKLCVYKAKKSGCWMWLGKCDPRLGYGAVERVWKGKRYVLAHRLAYAVLVGEIPDGYTIDHLCLNRACCNPEHLEAVTFEENLRRKYVRLKCPRGHRYNSIGFRKDRGLYARCSVCDRQRRMF